MMPGDQEALRLSAGQGGRADDQDDDDQDDDDQAAGASAMTEPRPLPARRLPHPVPPSAGPPPLAPLLAKPKLCCARGQKLISSVFSPKHPFCHSIYNKNM